MKTRVNTGESREANRTAKKAVGKSAAELASAAVAEEFGELTADGEDVFIARVVDRLMKNAKSLGLEGKSRSELTQMAEAAELELDAQFVEKNRHNFKMLSPEENRAALKRHGLLND